jgi:beta-lactamase class C
VTPDTVFHWASLSKGVAAAPVVGLVEEGKLSLERPVAGMGTTLTLPGDAEVVTVADLLSHRVGVVRHAGDHRLEAVSGEDYAAVAYAGLFAPPGMRSTRIGRAPRKSGFRLMARQAASRPMSRASGQNRGSARIASAVGSNNGSARRICW